MSILLIPFECTLVARAEFTDGGLRFIVFLMVMMPAAILALSKSTQLIDWYLFVVCTNRLARRFFDWYDGAFDPTPISSLAPLLIVGLMGAVVVLNFSSLPPSLRKAFGMAVCAVAFGSIVGFRYGIGMIYSALEFTAPVCLAFYPVVTNAGQADFLRWMRRLSALLVLICLYGWNQWVSYPPWDAAWIEWSRMWTSMGHPKPYETAICATMESRGPFAWFLAMASVPLFLMPASRALIQWPGVAFIVATMLPTTVRSGFGILSLGVLGGTVLRGGQSLLKTSVGLVLIVGAFVIVRQQMPKSEKLFERLETVTDLSNDGSFKGRTEIARGGLMMLATNPFGYGLGSSGLAMGKMASSQAIVADNGYIEFFTSLGMPGGLLMILCFWQFARIAWAERDRIPEISNVALATTMAGMGAMLFANWFPTPCSCFATLALGVVASEHIRLNQLSDLNYVDGELRTM